MRSVMLIPANVVYNEAGFSCDHDIVSLFRSTVNTEPKCYFSRMTGTTISEFDECYVKRVREYCENASKLGTPNARYGFRLKLS